MGSISRDGDAVPTGPANSGARRKSGGQGGARGSPYARPSGDSWKHDKYDEVASKPAESTATPQGGSLAARLSGGVTPLGPGKGARSSKLLIKDLHYEVSERELELLFVQIGPIASGPKIRFDKSGRSTGLAFIGYTSEEHAQQAKEAFDGALAKGQNIRVEYDFRPERTQAAPGSLLARLDNNPNGGRGGRGGAATAVRAGRPHVGPQRGVGSEARPPRSGAGVPGAPRNPRGGAGVTGSSTVGGGGGRGSGGGGGGGGRNHRREPKTNDDLDKELEAFMKKPEETDDHPATTTTQAVAPQADTAGDIEMS